LGASWVVFEIFITRGSFYNEVKPVLGTAQLAADVVHGQNTATRPSNQLEKHMLTSQKTHRAPLDLEPLNWPWSGIAQGAADTLNALPYPRHYLIMADDTAQSTDDPKHWECLTEDETWTGITHRACSAVQARDGGTRRTCAQSLVFVLGPKDTGPVFVWGLDIARQALNKLSAAFPELAFELQGIQPRLVDLQAWVHDCADHPHLGNEWAHGQTSPLFMVQLVAFMRGATVCAWLGECTHSIPPEGGDLLARACAVLRREMEATHQTLIFGPVALLQRRLKLSYAKTLALVEQLQAHGVLSPVVQMPILAQSKEVTHGDAA
jgi:hypothetical protein